MSAIKDRTKLSDPAAAHRRRMRKGTRSCLPCRSRKIRCTFPTNSRTCDSCNTHGRECVEQTYQDVKNGGLDKRVGLKQRVHELETLVQQLVEKGGADARALEETARNRRGDLLSPPQSVGGRSHGNEASPPGLSTEPSIDDDDSSDAYDSLDDVEAADTADYDFQKAPLMALFDNSLFLRDDPKDSPPPPNDPTQMGLFSVSRHGASSRARQVRLAQELRALIPPWKVIKAMLNHESGLLSLWNVLLGEHNFLGMSNIEECLHQNSQSDQLMEVFKALTIFTLIMQQTPENVSKQTLEAWNGKPQTDLFQKYLETIESHLCTGNTVIGSLDGLECAVLFSRILFNAGRPRKAWLLYERALSFARLLGFHRSSSWKTEPDPSIGRRREQTWWHLFIGDRAVSLLLGLPYSVLDAHVGIDSNSFTGTVPDPLSKNMFVFDSFYMRLGIITGRIIDRNHNNTSNTASLYAETMKIDGELHSLEVSMPKKWLALCEEEGDLAEFMDMSLIDIFEASNAQIWHHECRIALHMPYMMRNSQYSQEAGKYEYSRTVALRSARSLIRSHLRLREHPELSNVVCQVVDFQVFMAAVLLILDLLSRSKGVSVPRILQRDAESLKDEHLIRDAYAMLDRLAKQNTHRTNIPSQATKVLDTLGHLIHGQAVPGAERTNRRIVIPYFGAITIKASKALVEHRKEFEAHLQKEGCPSSGHLAGTPQSEPCPSEAQTMPTPRSFQSIEINQPGSQANDLTFSSFVAPQQSSFGASQAGFANSTAQDTAPLDYSSMDLSSFLPQSDMDIDAQMWDDGLWQNMLTQDLSLDLDVDWGSLPLEGAVS